VFQRGSRPARILLEARAKGTPDSVINSALELGVNLRVEVLMEQMGLPFHPTHVNPPDQTTAGMATPIYCAIRSATRSTGGCGTAARRALSG
jgi:hypothetical protein